MIKIEVTKGTCNGCERNIVEPVHELFVGKYNGAGKYRNIQGSVIRLCDGCLKKLGAAIEVELALHQGETR